MMAEVKMFTKPGCPYCQAAKEHYDSAGIAYDEVDVVGNAAAQKELLDLSGGRRIVPVIVDKGEVKVGWGGG
jgi:glutaredoxin 3